ncbi:universal stress protein [Streptacidiphilus sp. PB12-B1b]|uniref:universal stress protein n=1 Tax=Streptacidiphilus sp. PB12-B1b TaxID=2705012 RepID=UPI0015F961C9|nr:universal stress protein [Streptacidiphilus sp. PB12-B1b]QMU74656.1 universal stress protein [Streptacidiphilus sp. PB12-B1b]
MKIACVVAAVDGSPSSLLAVDRAADTAHQRGIALRLVHADPRERYERGIPDEDPHSERQAVRQMLSRAAERAEVRRPGLPLRTEVLADDPVSALLGLERLDPLLVLGSRGRGGFHGLLLGSVSLRVAARAAYPVLVVRDTSHDRAHGRGRVVLGVGTGPNDEAIGFAAAEAQLRGAALDLVHAWPPHRHAGAPEPAEAFAAMDATAARVRAELDARGGAPVRVERRTAPGTPASVLLEAAQEADLVVVGAHRRRGHLGLQLGPVNHAMLHYAPCPVAVVAHTPAA